MWKAFCYKFSEIWFSNPKKNLWLFFIPENLLGRFRLSDSAGSPPLFPLVLPSCAPGQWRRQRWQRPSCLRRRARESIMAVFHRRCRGCGAVQDGTTWGSGPRVHDGGHMEAGGTPLVRGSPCLRLLRRGSERRTQPPPKRAGPSALIPFFSFLLNLNKISKFK
jgi:hypothetical protein